MKTILICTDGSPYASSIYEHAAWAADRGPYALHVIYSVDLPGKVDADETAALNKIQSAQDHGNKILDEARERLSQLGAKQVTLDIQYGNLADVLETLAPQTEWVVIGKRGESADHLSPHFGSNLERVIKTSTRPVWVVPRAFEPIERFLIAYDGGPSAKKALEFVSEQAFLKGLECHLVQAGKLHSDEEWDLQERAARLTEVGFSVTTHNHPGPPDTVIVDTLENEGCQMLIMGAYGHSKLREFLIGSTTATLIREAAVPILMFR